MSRHRDLQCPLPHGFSFSSLPWRWDKESVQKEMINHVECEVPWWILGSILVKWWTLLNWANPYRVDLTFRCRFLHSRFFKGEALFSRAFILFLYHSSFFSLNFMLFLPSSLIYCSKLKILFLHNLHRNCSITKNKGVTQRAKWTILAVTGTVFAFWHCFLTFFVNSLLLWWP